MQRQGPEQKRWWVDEKFLGCIKQLFFPREPWWKPWRIWALCLSSQLEWCGHLLSPRQHPRTRRGCSAWRSGVCFGGCFVLRVLRADPEGQTRAQTRPRQPTPPPAELLLPGAACRSREGSSRQR